MNEEGQTARARGSPQKTASAEDPASPDPVRLAESGDLPMHYCPNCSQRLEERGCKLRCGRCGYFMDCSDYY